MEEKNGSKFKIIAIILAALVLLICIVVVVVNVGGGENPGGSASTGKSAVSGKGNITSFSYNYGSTYGGQYEYKMTRHGGSVLFEAKCIGGVDDFDVSKELDTATLDDLAQLIRNNNVMSWNGFDASSDDGRENGDGFAIKVVYDNNEVIEGHGYMIYPAGYRDAQKSLTDFLKQQVEAE